MPLWNRCGRKGVPGRVPEGPVRTRSCAVSVPLPNVSPAPALPVNRSRHADCSSVRAEFLIWLARTVWCQTKRRSTSNLLAFVLLMLPQEATVTPEISSPGVTGALASFAIPLRGARAIAVFGKCWRARKTERRADAAADDSFVRQLAAAHGPSRVARCGRERRTKGCQSK
jgi:hypothetical protein